LCAHWKLKELSFIKIESAHVSLDVRKLKKSA